MKEFKSIITHPEGQNLFPGQITTIEGYPHGTSITMQNTKPQIALTPYGASYMMPNMDYKFAGNTVVELPMAQMGGQDQQQQLMQMIQIYAQMKGMKPEELIQKLQSLPKEQQEQAVQSIAQEVQQAMAQQQESQMAQQEQEGAANQQGEMGMAQKGKQKGKQDKSLLDKLSDKISEIQDTYFSQILPSELLNRGYPSKPINWKKIGNDIGTGINNFIKTSPVGVMLNTPIPGLSEYFSQEQQLEEGGEPCFGCYDHYNPSPQAQNLNWFYKAQGGEAFPQANTYPEDWGSYHGNQYAMGGNTVLQSDPNAQTYLPNDRPHETRPNFMFETGGQSNIEDIYRIMKEGGIDYNPSKKKGGKFNHLEEFQKYLEKGGGLKKYQYDNSITGTGQTNDDDQTPFAKPSMMAEVGEIRTPPIVAPDPYSKSAQKEAAVNSYVNTGALPQGTDASKPYNPYTNPTNYKPVYNSDPKGGMSVPKPQNTPNNKNKSGDGLNMLNAMTGNKGLIGALTTISNIGSVTKDVAAGWSHPGRAFKNQYEDGGELDKYQAWMSQPGSSFQHSDTPLTTFVLPQELKLSQSANLSQPANNSFGLWNNQIPAKIQNSAGYQSVQNANQNATRIADQNIPNTRTDQNISNTGTDQTGGTDQIAKSDIKGGFDGWSFDFKKAEGDVAKLAQIGDYLHNFKEKNDPNKDKERRNMFTSEFMNVAQVGGGQYGDWSTNATQGTSFRPDEQVYAQKMGRPYKDVTVHDYSTTNFGDAFWGRTAKKGGTILDKYNEDEEYDLTEEEIRQILAAGGTIEYL